MNLWTVIYNTFTRLQQLASLSLQHDVSLNDVHLSILRRNELQPSWLWVAGAFQNGSWGRSWLRWCQRLLLSGRSQAHAEFDSRWPNHPSLAWLGRLANGLLWWSRGNELQLISLLRGSPKLGSPLLCWLLSFDWPFWALFSLSACL